jgi:hypothetical protein
MFPARARETAPEGGVDIDISDPQFIYFCEYQPRQLIPCNLWPSDFILLVEH